MSTCIQSPRIGIVIPVYKHSVLVTEAISSVLNQMIGASAITLVINDGCPLEETARAVRTMAQAYPEQIINLHTPNGGLSAARNRGIQLLLDHYPSIEGIFLLDADNRLEPGSFQLFEKLLDSSPEADWFYPHFDMFGLTQNATHGGEWSLLMHSADNLCEAGSLVRRRLFEKGVRYDETMRLGYEDWDFWLSAAKQGFRGQPVAARFFQYRKRPESMLSGSHRVNGEIRSFMRRKHSWLYNPRNVTAIEQFEAPRMRIFFSDSGRILGVTDPHKHIRKYSREDFLSEAWRWLITPLEAEAGAIWIVTDESTWAALKKVGLLRFALWDLEVRSDHKSVSTLVFEESDKAEYSISDAPEHDAAHLQAGMVAVGTDLIRQLLVENQSTWFDDLLSKTPSSKLSNRVLTAVGFAGLAAESTGTGILHLHKITMMLRASRYHTSTGMNWDWRTNSYELKEKISHLSQKAADTETLYPFVNGPDDPPAICFLLPIAQFGGVETVALNLAACMRRRGWHTTICIIGTNPIRLADRIETGFDEIMWFPDSGLLEWGGPVYQGTHLARSAEGRTARQLLGLLGAFDCVMGCNPGGAVSILGPLRKIGVVTALHEHVVETNRWGRHSGTPIIALAYEAAVDIIATCSNQLAEWLHANGVPQAKLVPVPNAAGYQLPDEQRFAVLEARKQLPQKRPLRVLFLGRLDLQKGLDRLATVIRHLQTANLDVDWRVVGKAILADHSAGDMGLKDLVEVESPVYTPEGRTELYAWADVVLLPSRYEGLPLTVFEAQQLGAVPIMTKVGAYTEAVNDGINGILVSEDNCVEEMCAALKLLDANRALLREISERAAKEAATWDTNATPLIDRLHHEVILARKRLSHRFLHDTNSDVLNTSDS